jgi:hypothetical protein
VRWPTSHDRHLRPFAMAWQALPVGDRPRPNALARRPVARRDEARRAGFDDTGAGDASDVPGVWQLRAVLSLRPAGKGCQAAAACRRVEDVSKVSVQEPTSRAAGKERGGRGKGRTRLELVPDRDALDVFEVEHGVDLGRPPDDRAGRLIERADVL